ncbi:beta-lactamase/transpeptidase-like protein, partial [Amanita rubescens]
MKARIVSEFSVGHVYKYADVNGTLLSRDQWIPATNDTVYDMASITKLFTTILVLQQLERGIIELYAPVAKYIPDFATNGKENITIEMLLTHTSGFEIDPLPPLWIGYKTIEERKKATIKHRIINPPGSTYLYSDLNFMNLRYVLEAVTNTPFDELMKKKFTGPLRMTKTYFNKGNNHMHDGIAPTEYQTGIKGRVAPNRPQPVWGMVHDENGWSLDGVSGHAGIFSTAHDLAIFCQMILNEGTYGDLQILKPSTVELIFTNFNTKFPGHSHGLGFELDQCSWSGPMASLDCAGHTGFAGTCMAIDRASKTFFILLTNRVHPTRNWSNISIVRQTVGYYVAKALG